MSQDSCLHSCINRIIQHGIYSAAYTAWPLETQVASAVFRLHPFPCFANSWRKITWADPREKSSGFKLIHDPTKMRKGRIREKEFCGMNGETRVCGKKRGAFRKARISTRINLKGSLVITNHALSTTTALCTRVVRQFAITTPVCGYK